MTFIPAARICLISSFAILSYGCNRGAEEPAIPPAKTTVNEPVKESATQPVTEPIAPAKIPEAPVAATAKKNVDPPVAPATKTAKPSPMNPAPATPPAKPAEAQSPPSVAQAKPPVAPAPAPAPPAAKPVTVPNSPVTLDLVALEKELKSTKAIGLFSKIALKNQVDDLMKNFRQHYKGKIPPTMTELRSSYDLLMMKVLSMVQDEDKKLASDIVASRAAIWDLLSDPKKFAALDA